MRLLPRWFAQLNVNAIVSEAGSYRSNHITTFASFALPPLPSLAS